MKVKSLCFIWISFLVLGSAGHSEEKKGAGTIEGRVLNVSTGEYLEKARITVEGTSTEAFTGAAGEFVLGPIPQGAVQVHVFYTGATPLSESVIVDSDRVVHNFNLVPLDDAHARQAGRNDTIELAAFTVSTSRQMDGAAVAINEQRFAPNVKNVVDSKEFGISADGSVAEFIKYLPGISVNYVGGTANTISIEGAPANNVPITVGGFDLASTSSASTSRAAELLQLSIKNLSRLELIQSPTPESPGSALAGSINLVPTSAFDFKSPVLDVSVFMMMRDNYKDLNPTPGPYRGETRKVQPGFDIQYIQPINDRFGFTFAASYSNQFIPQDTFQAAWRGAGFATNGTTIPDTTSAKPYLSDYTLTDARKFNERKSFSLSFDYKLSAYDTLSFDYEFGTFSSEYTSNVLTFNVNNITSFDQSYTHGGTGGTLTMSASGRWRGGDTNMPTLLYRHAGPLWTVESGVGYSRSTNFLRDNDRGYFGSVTARRTNVALSFDGINSVGPGTVTVVDSATGASIDPYKTSSYALATAGNPNPRDSYDVKKTAFANLARSFSLFNQPMLVKGGIDVRQSMRDIRGTATTSNFVGPDGKTSTNPSGGDDSAAAYADTNFSAHGEPYGFPRTEWLNIESLYALSGAHPGYFVFDDNSAYRNVVSNSKWAQETISSAYVRTDLSLLKNKLKLIFGVRGEQTNVKAEGALTDPTRNFQKDGSGNVIVGSNGGPLLIVPTSNALGVSQLTFLDRQAKADKEYLRLFPSINASYSFLNNFVARASYYYSVGRPDYIQYTGGLTLPNTELPPGTGGNIVVNNAGIKAWSARTAKVRLEYYFEGVGVVSVGAFRRDFENFFGAVITPATPQFLALYNLDPAVYGQYDVTTQYNLPNMVRMTGLEFNYKQALTFLPGSLRGFQVFANATILRVQGADAAATSLTGFVPKTVNWGFSFTRPKYSLRAGWNYSGRRKTTALQAGRGLDPGTFQYNPGALKLDLQAEYYFWKRTSIFANLRNVTDATEDLELYGPNTPSYARLRQRDDYGASWTFGLKSRF